MTVVDAQKKMTLYVDGVPGAAAAAVTTPSPARIDAHRHAAGR